MQKGPVLLKDPNSIVVLLRHHNLVVPRIHKHRYWAVKLPRCLSPCAKLKQELKGVVKHLDAAVALIRDEDLSPASCRQQRKVLELTRTSAPRPKVNLWMGRDLAVIADCRWSLRTRKEK